MKGTYGHPLRVSCRGVRLELTDQLLLIAHQNSLAAGFLLNFVGGAVLAGDGSKSGSGGSDDAPVVKIWEATCPIRSARAAVLCPSEQDTLSMVFCRKRGLCVAASPPHAERANAHILRPLQRTRWHKCCL